MGKAKKSWSDEGQQSRFGRIVDRAKDFYRTYTAGLKSGDFKKLFTEETRGVYSRFDTDTSTVKKGRNFKEALKSVGRIFWGFLLALSPARRILYGIAFLIFATSAIVTLTAPYNSALRQDMTTMSIYSFIIVSFLLALELADKLSARDEIEIARDVQLSLLPPEDPRLPGLKVASFSAPAAEVGGDYYDFASIKSRTCLAIGDVSGHGLASGLVMAMAKSAWQAQLINNPEPSQVLSTLNRIVWDAGGSRTFMTFLHCVLEHEESRLVFANAGHIYPLHYRPGDGNLRWIETTPAYPLGVRPQQKYECNTVSLKNGDILVFLSDGAVEATNEEGVSFGYNNFVNAVRDAGTDDPRDILDGILSRLESFVKQATREDDLTVIVARYFSSAEEQVERENNET